MEHQITAEQWEHFEENGYVRIGQVATDAELAQIQQRMDDIMLGKAPLDYDQIMMQLDREPGKNVPGPQSKGHKGATLLYRKIQNLELDPIFLAYLQKPDLPRGLREDLRRGHHCCLFPGNVYE